MTDFSNHRTADILAYYNEAAAELGRDPVKRFADRATAEARAAKIAEELRAHREAKGSSTRPTKKTGEQKLIDHLVAGAVKKSLEGALEKGPTPPVGGKPERWRKAKRLEPSRVAYRPRAGSLQATMHGLLTQPGGIAVEAFCAAMNAAQKPGTKPWEPKTAWGFLGYLFVSQKGYGLDFDGDRLQLLVPKDEREQASKKGA